MIEMLNILEHFDLPKLGALSPQTLHSRSKRCAAPISIARATSAIPTS